MENPNVAMTASPSALRETQSDAQRYYDALRKIAREYMTPEQCARHAASYGCSPEEMIEMSYENIQNVAEVAIKGKRRPKA